MNTVKEVSKLAGVSARTLHHYDKIGLLSPSKTTKAGYRLYDETALERLQMILLFRELKFPLKEIKRILESQSFDRARALEDQIHLLMLQKEHIENLIDLAKGIQVMGVKKLLDFKAFDTRKIDEYAEEAKKRWGGTDAYRECEEKMKGRTGEENKKISEDMMGIFREFGEMRTKRPQDADVQALVQKLRDFITEHFYQCTLEILKSLGGMYAGGGSMTENIDKAGGNGTAAFAEQAILIYCQK